MVAVVRGSEQFRDLGRRLKEAGDEGGVLRRELLRSCEDATSLLREELVASALNTLPHRGGLAAVVAGSKISTQRRLTGSRAGVRVVTENEHHINTMDKGTVRHPLFGNRSKWFTEAVRPGWWSRPIDERGPRAKEKIEEAMQRTKESIERL